MYLIVIPACNEEACLPEVLAGLKAHLPADRFRIAVGVNASTDATARVAKQNGSDFVGETAGRGYGHGCRAAIRAAIDSGFQPAAYIFVAADGANRWQDILRLTEAHEETGAPLVIGLRRFRLRTWAAEFGRALPNLILGAATALLTGKFYSDLGPLRLIERDACERMQLRELVWGWTIEAQVMAARLGLPVHTLEVIERPRLRGRQKVSGVSPWHSLNIGLHILAAGVRTRFRPLSFEQEVVFEQEETEVAEE